MDDDLNQCRGVFLEQVERVRDRRQHEVSLARLYIARKVVFES